MSHARRPVLFPQASSTHGAGGPGFSGRQPPATIKAAQLNRMIERLGVLQIDSVNAVVRSHYLPLFSRLGNYTRRARPGCLESGPASNVVRILGPRSLAAAPGVYPLMRWRMQRRAWQDIYQQLARLAVSSRRHPRVLGCRAQRTGRRQSVDPRGAAGPWWDWSAEKHALEWLFAA
jgi:uncharacterized protein YcaQ